MAQIKFQNHGFPSWEFPRDKRFHTDDVLGILKNYLKDRITNIQVYSNPLPSLPDVSVLIHAFVVFSTMPISSNPEEMWWSLEKNGKYIILQQSTKEKDVVDTTFDVNENKMNQRLSPVKELTSATGRGNLENMFESVSSQLELLYHLWSANCQRFASYVFRKCNGEGKTWKTFVSGSEANEKETLFGVSVDTIRYNSIDRETKRSPFYQALIENKELAELKAILADDTSEFINQVDCHGYTFLEWADAFSREDVKNYLIEKGAVQSELFRRNVFFIALQYVDSKDELNDPKLSFEGMDITVENRDKMDNTALHLALNGGKWQVANKILKKMKQLSIPVDAVNRMGETALQVITKLTCPIDTFEKILKRIPQDKIDMIDQQGYNALHWATVIGSPKKIKLLLKKGANINAQTRDGHTALDLALQDELNTDDNEKIKKNETEPDADNFPKESNKIKASLYLLPFSMDFMTS